MDANPAIGPIRRILIALDASAPSLAALEVVAALAARIDAELLGIFIEDVNLLHLAGLPFAAEVGMFSGRARPLAADEMERLLRAQRERAQRALADVSRRLRLRSSFRAARGQIIPELLAAAVEADLVALGAVGTQTARRIWLGSTAQAFLARAVRPLLIAPRGATIRSPIAVLYMNSPGAMHALALAAYVGGRLDDGELLILLVADDAEEEARLRQAAAARLAHAGAKIRYRWLVDADADELARVLRAERAGTLVLAGDTGELGEQLLRRLLEQADLAILIAGGD